MPECPRCGEPLTRDPQALAGGVGQGDRSSVLTCGDCGEQYLEQLDGALEPYRWA